MPATPILSVGIYLSGGSEADNKTADIIRFQVIVRDTSFSSGMTRAELIWGLLKNSWGNLLTKSRITADGQPGTRFRDDNELLNFSLNFTAFIPR